MQYSRVNGAGGAHDAPQFFSLLFDLAGLARNRMEEKE